MLTRKSYKFRIYPTWGKVAKLEHTLNLCRELYNSALDERKSAYDLWYKFNKGSQVTQYESGVVAFEQEVLKKEAAPTPKINYYSQANQLVEIKDFRPELKQVHSQVLQNVLKRLDLAFQAFFRRVKAGETPGYPRFKGKGNYDSFTFTQGGWSLKNNQLTLSNIGAIKVRLHREVIGKVNTCTIKREGRDKWFVVFALTTEIEIPVTADGPPIGIDVGLEHFANLSSGEQVENPRYFRKAEAKLAKAQHKWDKVKHLKKGDKARAKKGKVITRAHTKVKNCRSDFQHKLSTKLVKTYSVIVVEDLQVKNLLKRAKPKEDETQPGHFLPNNAAAKSGLSKSISDAGWSTFVNMLENKAESAGSRLIKIDPKHTSQICPDCGSVAKKDLAVRWHSCPCGCEMHRDTAAAKVIMRIGLDSLSSQPVEATPL